MFTQRLGYGKSVTEENNLFTRIIQGNIFDTEEVRKETYHYVGNGYEYVGVAISGTPTEHPNWTIVRVTYGANNKANRFQIRKDVSWDNRSIGW